MITGRAGSGPRALARRRAGRRLSATFACVSAAVAAGWLGEPALSVVAAAGAVAVWRMYRAPIARARAGAESEREVGELLRRVRVDLVAHGVRLPGSTGDIDVVLLGPVAAIVEVKRASGRTTVRGDGMVRVGGTILPGRPGRQAVAAAAALRRQLGSLDRGWPAPRSEAPGVDAPGFQVGRLPSREHQNPGPFPRVDAILCVTGMRQRPRRVRVGSSDLVVCSARHLRRVIRRLEPRLSADESAAAVAAVAGW